MTMDQTLTTEKCGQMTAPETMPERVAEIDWLIRVLKAHGFDQMNMIPIITAYIDAGVPVKAFDP